MIRQKQEQENRTKKVSELQRQKTKEMLKNCNGMINDVMLSETEISWEGKALKGHSVSDFLALKRYNDQDISFHRLHSDYIEYVSDNIRKGRKFDGMLGNCKVTALKRKSYVNINNRKIKIKDTYPVLMYTLKCLKIEHFNKYLDKIDGISLAALDLLEHGLEIPITLEDSEFDLSEGILLNFKRKSRNFCLNVNNKLHRLSNICSFISLKRDIGHIKKHNQEIMESNLSDYEKRSKIKEYSLDKIIEWLSKKQKINDKLAEKIILSGIDNFAAHQKELQKIRGNRIEKSRKFLKSAIKLTKAFKTKHGLQLKGNSGKSYLIKTDSSCWEIIDMKNAKHICIDNTATNIDLKDLHRQCRNPS